MPKREENRKFFLKETDMDNLPELTTKRKLILVVFVVSFLIMIWGVLAWEDLGITIWPTMGWWFPELAGVFLAASVIVAVIARMGDEEFMDTFINGCKDLLSVAVIIGVARGVSIVMSDARITDTILHFGESLLVNTSQRGVLSVHLCDLSGAVLLCAFFLWPRHTVHGYHGASGGLCRCGT